MVDVAGESKILNVDPLARLEVVELLDSGFLRIPGKTGFVIIVDLLGGIVGPKKLREVETRIGNNGITIFAGVKI